MKPVTFAWISVSLLVSLGILGWFLFPEDAGGWAFAIFFLPGLWGFLELAQAADSRSRKTPIVQWHRVVTGCTALFMAAGLATKLALATGALDASWTLPAT